VVAVALTKKSGTIPAVAAVATVARTAVAVASMGGASLWAPLPHAGSTSIDDAQCSFCSGVVARREDDAETTGWRRVTSAWDSDPTWRGRLRKTGRVESSGRW